MTQGDVWRFCAHLADRARADDLTQETYLRAIPSLRRFRGDSTVMSWLLTIARRVVADELRREGRRARLERRLAIEGGPPAGVPGDGLEWVSYLGGARCGSALGVCVDPGVGVQLRRGGGGGGLPGGDDPLAGGQSAVVVVGGVAGEGSVGVADGE